MQRCLWKSSWGGLGMGMKHLHAGITWIFSMVVPAGSSLDWSLCRQRKKPAKRLLPQNPGKMVPNRPFLS